MVLLEHTLDVRIKYVFLVVWQSQSAKRSFQINYLHRKIILHVICNTPLISVVAVSQHSNSTYTSLIILISSLEWKWLMGGWDVWCQNFLENLWTLGSSCQRKVKMSSFVLHFNIHNTLLHYIILCSMLCQHEMHSSIIFQHSIISN